MAFWAASHAPAAQAVRGFETGINEPDYVSEDQATQSLAFARSAEARATFSLIYVNWAAVAPSSKPLGFVPANPADPNYRWSAIDAAVRDANARGLRALLAVTKAPSWAEGPGRPPAGQAPAGTWKPDPGELGAFARALASRYSGALPGLPAVRYWQVWAEPNLGVNLSPQFEGNRPVGFDVYRPMLNAFYSNVKAVSSQNQVITGGTAPYGNLTPAGGLSFQRMQPLDFWRGLLCVRATKKGKKGHRGRRLVRVPRCNPPRFDIAAHHPINVGPPTRHALNADDASTPDIGKVRRVIRAGVGRKPIWATEIWWNSNPPSKGVPLKTQARYLSQSFYVLWKQRVPVAIWFELRDAQPTGAPTPTSGLRFRDGTPKPALQAFGFPFAAERLSRARVRVWGLAPDAGPVQIGMAKGRHFRRIRKLKAGPNRVFVGLLHLRRGARLQARQGSESSLTWRQR